MEQHLAGCAACHERLEGQRFAARLVANLPLPATTTVPVCPSWALPPADDAQPPARPRKLVLQLAAATALLTIIATGVWFFLRPRGASWEVARLSGTPTIAARSLELTSRWYAGEWLETDAAARALVHVGQIGQVEVDPNSRIRLIKTGADEYRIRLARGRIYAGIVAAPRLFLVETPSATAIDLGCAYTLDVDEDGGNLLRVTSGWVALARDGLPRPTNSNSFRRSGSFVERPKVIYNPQTKKFVMWMHLERGRYTYSRAGVATSDTPTGPFTFLHAIRPITNDFNFNPNSPTQQKEFGGTFRDMNVFVDDDGRAYVFYSSEDNWTMYVVRLNDDYTGPELPAIEGLARVDVVCADKTGTLTENGMRVSDVAALGDDDVADVLAAMAANDPRPNASMQAIAEKYSHPPGWTVTATAPFKSATKWSGVSFGEQGNWVIGAPDVLLHPDTDAARQAQDIGAGGLRVLLLARGDAAVDAPDAPGRLIASGNSSAVPGRPSARSPR